MTTPRSNGQVGVPSLAGPAWLAHVRIHAGAAGTPLRTQTAPFVAKHSSVVGAGGPLLRRRCGRAVKGDGLCESNRRARDRSAAARGSLDDCVESESLEFF